MKKHTFEYVKMFFKQNNCELLEKEYINSKIKMKYKCICKNTAIITFNEFQQGKRCMKCSGTPVHTYEHVNSFIIEKNCMLISTDYKNVNTKLKVICSCKNEYLVSFKAFQLNVRCSNCTIDKTKNTNLEKFGVEYSMQNKDIQQKSKDTCLEKYGVEYSSQNKDIKDKIREKHINKTDLELLEIQNKRKQTTIDKYGVEHHMFNEDVKHKIKETNLERYGVEHQMFNEDVKHKIKETNLERYGVENVFQNEDVKHKIKETNLERYGVEHQMFNEDVKHKIKETNLERYGVENVFQNEDVKHKIKETNLERYGVEYPMQNYEIAEKSHKNSYNLKEYTLPSNNIVKVQGYEPFALDILLKIFNENDIIIERKDIPIIKYETNKKIFTYYPDIFIPKENKIIEVKSIWTYNVNLEKNILKQKASINNGYNFEFWIFNNKGQKINQI